MTRRRGGQTRGGTEQGGGHRPSLATLVMLAVLVLLLLVVPTVASASSRVPPTHQLSRTSQAQHVARSPQQPHPGNAASGRGESRAKTTSTSDGLQVTLARITPQVATGDTPVTVLVKVTNTAETDLERMRVRLRLAADSLRSRHALRAWLDVPPKQAPPIVEERVLPITLRPRESVAVEMRLPAGEAIGSRAFGVGRLLVEARSQSAVGTVRTALPYQRRAEYTPMRISFAVPLTLDPNPLLLTDPVATDRGERERVEAAWTKTIGPESRLQRVLTATKDLPVTWAIDPALLPVHGTGGAAVPLRPDSGASGSAGSSASSSDSSGDSSASASAGGTGTRSMVPAPENPETSETPTAPEGSETPGASETARTSATADTAGAEAAVAPMFAAPSPTPTPTSPSRATGSSAVVTPTPVGAEAAIAHLRTDLATRLRDSSSQHPLWQLPEADPDVAAMLHAYPDRTGLLGALVPPSSDLAGPLGRPATPVAWPVGAPLTATQRSTLAAAYRDTRPVGYLTPLDEATQTSAESSAARRSWDGLPVLGYDVELSRLFATTSGTDAAENAQRFVAESALLLAQAPSRRRSVLVVAPRDFDPEPTSMTRLFDGVGAAPWLVPSSTRDLESEAADPSTPTIQEPHGPSPWSPDQSASNPPVPGRVTTTTAPSPLTLPTLTQVESGLAMASTVESVVPRGNTFATQVATALRSLLSTRWRSDPAAWHQARGPVQERVEALSGGIRIVPTSVNFFAETGALQVTVVNELPVDVHDVRLVLDAGGNRLQINRQPSSFGIRANSRATVRVEMTALAPGNVPLTARVVTPEGSQLGSSTTFDVQVQPTNGWVLLAVIAVAGLVFVAGLYRALRAGRTRVSEDELNQLRHLNVR